MVEKELKTLDELANYYGTDKGSKYPGGSRHGYADIYDMPYLNKWRDKSIRMLEIGLCLEPGTERTGQSVNMWYDYFSKAQIYTSDILDMHSHPCVLNLSDRVKFYQADQSDRDQLTAMYDSFGSKEFDFILEDGSHIHAHQMISFGHLFKYVKSGGYYIIEDVSIPDHWCCCIRNDETYRAVETLSSTGKIESSLILSEEKAYIEANIKSIEIHPDIQDAYATIVITKK